MEEKEENQTFKVVDKRRFNSEGSSANSVTENVNDHVTGPSGGNVIPEAESGNQKPVKDSEDHAQKPSSVPPQEINFSAFLMGIYTQTLIFLGDIPNPETNLVSVNLEAAKQNIAVLSVIEEKTRGNLTAEEEHLFKEILTTLRLQFVKKAKV
jgi:hypothetical protein